MRLSWNRYLIGHGKAGCHSSSNHPQLLPYGSEFPLGHRGGSRYVVGGRWGDDHGQANLFTQLSPPIDVPALEKGYLILPASYTSQTPSFSLDIGGFRPRFLSPHPYTNQNTLALARGPIVYCVEDHDNPQESNHFRDVTMSADALVREEDADCKGEKFIALRLSGDVHRWNAWNQGLGGSQPGTDYIQSGPGEHIELVFVPYYLRANRGGRGQMRVGLKRRSL